MLGPLMMTDAAKLGSLRPPTTEQLRLAWRFRGLDVRGLADVTG